MITVVRENHETPRDMQAKLTRAGGRTLGDHPVYRLIWGGRRLDKFDFQKYAYAPRLLNRWIVEKWDGRDYEFVTALEGRSGAFTPLNTKAIDLVVDLVEKSRGLSDFDRREWFAKEEARRQRDYDNFADAAIEDAMLPMYGQTSVYYGGSKRKPGTRV